MKKVCAFVAFSMLMPAALLAQVQVVPPVPPPAPVAPPALPPVPVVPPAPPVPMVVAAPVFDYVSIDDAMRASRGALAQIDTQAIRDQAREASERVREAAAEAREQARMQSELMRDMMPFSYTLNMPFDFQGRGVYVTTSNNTYDSGLSYLLRRQYDQAITKFDQVIAQKGTHVDGALFHKAEAQHMLGRKDEALATIAELRKSYPQSGYLEDVKYLEADVRKANGQTIATDANDEEIKILAISALQNSDPDRAVPLLESVLKSGNSLPIKSRALFVLAQNDKPAAHQLLLNYAKGKGNPDLQIQAIRYLTARSGRGRGIGIGPAGGRGVIGPGGAMNTTATASETRTSTAELMEIYNSTQDLDVRRAVLDALVSSGDKPAVFNLLNGQGTPVEIRQRAINNLGNGNLATPQEIFQLYQKEDNKELRMTMLRSLGNMGAVDQLTQVIRTEKDPSVRTTAIRQLGGLKVERTGQALVDLYGAEQDKDARKAIISALGSQNNAEGLVGIARKETNSELKLEIVRRLAEMAKTSKVASDYLMEVIK